MNIPRIPPKLIQAGLHWIMRMDDGEEESFDLSPEVIAEMNEASRLATENEPKSFPTSSAPPSDSPPAEPPAGEAETTI